MKNKPLCPTPVIISPFRYFNLIALCFALTTSLALARPRDVPAPLPEMEPILFHETFDYLCPDCVTNAQVTIPNYGVLIESWSWYALQRSGTVTPFIIPGVDSGHTNVPCDTGAIRMWVKPYWTSSSLTNGTGPGTYATLFALAVINKNQITADWTLQFDAKGSALSLIGRSDAGPVELLNANIAWQAGDWHLVTLDYGPGKNGTALFIDGQLAAEGAGTLAVSPQTAGVVIGSTFSGTDAIGGEIDEVYSFGLPLTAEDVAFYYNALSAAAALGPITAEEDQAWADAMAKQDSRGGGPQMRMLVGGTSECITNVPVYITNMVATFDTNQGWTVVTFDIQGSYDGTTTALYDVFSATNLSGPWTWLERGPTCSTYQYTNQPDGKAFYILGTPQDTDGDGYTDAFENLVRKSDPTVGENRVQSENAITGTTDWLLSHPVTVADSHGWPTNDADTMPEIEGFASATSINVTESLDLYVDVRNGNTNFTIEIFRLGWYGGLGGRRMTWNDNGATSLVTLTSHKQPVPVMNATNGLIDCLNQSASSNNWQKSYSVTISPDWASGVYVAKLTTVGAGKQSYIIFVVREDARSSDLLYQSSVTTFQAYNPWGGRSIYPYPDQTTCPNVVGSNTATTVSFNRPYAPTTCANNAAYLAYGAGAGEFLTQINQSPLPGFEYNMVRWLERQGYDVTYSTSIDTHRGLPANKTIKGLLSVGHDEYWSATMRTNVETLRDQGVNLGFFTANACYWKIYFESGERVFSVNKVNNADLWRGSNTNSSTAYPAEISMIGVEFVYINGLEGDITMANPLPSGSGIGGHHWAYDYSSLTNGQTLTRILGYEVDGCWDGPDPCNSITGACPGSNTVRLADSAVQTCINVHGQTITCHAYVTIYTNSSGAQVFATGSMQWNWGLDDFGFGSQLPWSSTNTSPWGFSRVRPPAQQMTHNVLLRFSGKTNAPVILTNVDTITSGNWTNLYGADGYWIAATNSITNLPAYAQVTFSNQNVQVWDDPSADPKALLKPGSTNRIASAWTTTDTQNSAFTIDLNLTDTNTHQIALYCVDWLGTGTVLEKIEVFESTDTSYANPLDTRDFDMPANGVYLVWKLSGHKIIRITKKDSISGNQAMVSGLFFGP